MREMREFAAGGASSFDCALAFDVGANQLHIKQSLDGLGNTSNNNLNTAGRKLVPSSPV